VATKDLRASGTLLLVLAATIAGSCAPPASGPRAVRPAGYRASTRTAGFPRAPTSRSETLRGYPAAFVAAVSRGIRFDPHGLAVFSSSHGRLLRWLVRRAPDPVPVSVSPDGRWVYYYDQGTPASGRCPATSFADPALWRVPTGGGRPQRTGIRTPSIAFSPDGRMMAYTVSSDCGRVIRIVVRNRRTGATRRIILARNNLRGNNQVGSAQLSWAPDDAHLAVAVAPAAAINTLSVINALRARTAITARSIPPCAGDNSGCLDPAFDLRGRLTFLKWREEAATSSFAEWVTRWHRGHAVRLFRLSGEQEGGGSASIAMDRTGNAVLLTGGIHLPAIWRWYGGQLRLILRSTASRVAWRQLWIPRRR
jgi:rubredoxin